MKDIFRTVFDIAPQKIKINLQESYITTVGSCFADNIGNKLLQNKFKVLANPFGTLFNPISIADSLLKTIRQENIDLSRLVYDGNLYRHYDLHTEMAANTQTELIENWQNIITNPHWEKQNILIITFGTAWVYTLIADGKIVANCQKQPAQQFQKRLLTVEEITQKFDQLYNELKNRHLPQIILTVSPVRHLKDTMPLNSLSKSLLIVACHQITDKYPDISYFPAYEIQNDDLRDYRFYGEDMLHPTEVAIEYIWNKFTDTYFDKPAKEWLRKWNDIYKALQHKITHPHTRQAKVFINQLTQKLEAVNEVDVTAELEKLRTL
jgi:hypothetical protein